MIGIVRRINNLYVLDLRNLFFQIPYFSIVCDSTILTQSGPRQVKLGHPFYVKHHRMKNDLHLVHSSNKPILCFVCHFSKQCHLPFISSNSQFNLPFQLLHIDI